MADPAVVRAAVENGPMGSNDVHTLLVIRHAKSDWSTPAADIDRPINARGRRQAPFVGRWIAEQIGPIDVAVVSVACRAEQTWTAIAAELDEQPIVQQEQAAYTDSGGRLVRLIEQLRPEQRVAAIVSHNPAVEELVEHLTGASVVLKTSALAVIDLPDWSDLGECCGVLRAVGRPADGPLPWL